MTLGSLLIQTLNIQRSHAWHKIIMPQNQLSIPDFKAHGITFSCQPLCRHTIMLSLRVQPVVCYELFKSLKWLHQDLAFNKNKKAALENSWKAQLTCRLQLSAQTGLFHAPGQWWQLKKHADDKWDPPDPDCSLPTFFIIATDQEPGIVNHSGYEMNARILIASKMSKENWKKTSFTEWCSLDFTSCLQPFLSNLTILAVARGYSSALQWDYCVS